MPPENASNANVPPASPADLRSGDGSDPLERLRDRIERAAEELDRLRTENRRLAERVGELGQDPLIEEQDGHQEPVDLLEGDPEALRSKIQQFIEALDRVLAERAAPPSPQ